ncbi:MAG: DNA repair protein RecO [Alphaproteobacteria bacterium]
MDWDDDAIILSVRRHGERGVIVDALTSRYGRHAGLVRYGASKQMRGVLEPGNEVNIRWRARLSEHLGNYTVELVRARAAAVMRDPLRLAGLTSACAMAQQVLPEREPHGPVFEGMRAMLDAIENIEMWPAALVRWELGMLEELGFGLDLSKCAATGAIDDLIYVSPRTGRAVGRAPGLPYRERLMPLPGFLLGAQLLARPADILAGLNLTGFFLARHLLEPHRKPMPPARSRLCDRLKLWCDEAVLA